jgi:biotin-independent malonate decarboxylase gamma subunit
MSANGREMGRGRVWFEVLAGAAHPPPDGPSSVLVADGTLGGERARYLSVVPDLEGRFPRARGGEVGLEEAWFLARYVREALDDDRDGDRRAIVAIVDVPSQAYGLLEDLLGIHLALAAATDAYATARLAGHPVVALIVGQAISGGLLAHGYQADRVLALDDPGVEVHAMEKQAAARVTRRAVEELDELAERVPPMAYDVRTFAGLGILHRLIRGVDADDPGPEDVERVEVELASAIADARSGSHDLANRLDSDGARRYRAASIEVRKRLAEQWTA